MIMQALSVEGLCDSGTVGHEPRWFLCWASVLSAISQRGNPSESALVRLHQEHAGVIQQRIDLRHLPRPCTPWMLVNKLSTMCHLTCYALLHNIQRDVVP